MVKKASTEETPGVDFGEEVAASEGSLSIDLSGVKAGGTFAVIPMGVYDVMLYDLTFSFSKSSGNPMWTWVFEIINLEEFANRRVFYHTTFTEGGLPRLVATLERIVLDDADDEEYRKGLLGTSFNPEEVAAEGRLLGARARARLTVRKYEGEPRNNVQMILPPREVLEI